MNTQKQNKDLGTMGETHVLNMLIDKGFSLYKRNIRQWGLELDLVVYKYTEATKFLQVRVVEVKTRVLRTDIYQTTYGQQLEQYGIDAKWNRARPRLYGFKEQITSDVGLQVLGHGAHFDFALVSSRSKAGSTVDPGLKISMYIKDVNLFI